MPHSVFPPTASYPPVLGEYAYYHQKSARIPYMTQSYRLINFSLAKPLETLPPHVAYRGIVPQGMIAAPHLS